MIHRTLATQGQSDLLFLKIILSPRVNIGTS